MSVSNKSLYFIAIIPPEPVSKKAQEFRLYFSEKFNSSHALKSPPHITLLSPFYLPDGKEKSLNVLLTEFSGELKPVKITLTNFSCFSDRVIFIEVNKGHSLKRIQTKLEKFARSRPELFNYNYDDRPYHPHLTLAFKDLTKKNFHKAWGEFKNKEFEAEFIADKLTLLKHNGERWKIIDRFNFRKET